MNHTEVRSWTSVSRIEGPVCITRLAMRPAKSFWKKPQDWRTTCQWFCQRMRFETFTAIAWLIINCCTTKAPGFTTRNSASMAANLGQPLERSYSRGVVVTSDTSHNRKQKTKKNKQKKQKHNTSSPPL